jgi:hypothetical protein
MNNAPDPAAVNIPFYVNAVNKILQPFFIYYSPGTGQQ